MDCRRWREAKTVGGIVDTPEFVWLRRLAVYTSSPPLCSAICVSMDVPLRVSHRYKSNSRAGLNMLQLVIKVGPKFFLNQ